MRTHSLLAGGLVSVALLVQSAGAESLEDRLPHGYQRRMPDCLRIHGASMVSRAAVVTGGFEA